MSISNTSERRAGPFPTDGVDVEFPFEFKVFEGADLVVTSSEDGVDTVLVFDVDYTVELNADQEDDPGGAVTLAEALDGPVINITSGMDYTQPTVFTNAGGFYPRVLNNSLDRVTILIQQLKELVSRALVAPFGAEGVAGSYVVVLPDGTYGYASGTGNDAALRTDLASSTPGKGFSLISFLLSTAAGAIVRLGSEKLDELPSVKDFGAKGNTVRNGVTGIVTEGDDDTEAFQLAIDEATHAAHNDITYIRIPPGDYLITDTLRIDKHKVGLVGVGDKSRLVFKPTEDNKVMILVQNSDTEEHINFVTLSHFSIVADYSVAVTGYRKTAIKLIDASLVKINHVNMLDYSWVGGSGRGSIGIHFCGRDTHNVRECNIIADQPMLGDVNPNHFKYVFDCHNFYGLWLETLKSTNYAIDFEPGCLPTNWTIESNSNTYRGKGGIRLDNSSVVLTETPSMIRINQFRCESGTLSGGTSGGYGVYMDFGAGNPACSNITLEHSAVNDPSCNGYVFKHVSSLLVNQVNAATTGTSFLVSDVDQCQVFSLGVNDASTRTFTDMEARDSDLTAGATSASKSIARATYVRNASGAASGHLRYENGVRRYAKTVVLSNSGEVELPSLTNGQSMMLLVSGDGGGALYHFNFATVVKLSGSASFDTAAGGAATTAISDGAGANKIVNVSAGASKTYYITSVGG